MKKFLPLFLIVISAFCFESCLGIIDDVPKAFVYIGDGSGVSNAVVSNGKNGSSTLYVTLVTSSSNIQEDIKVYYEAIPGNGLKENVDYKIKEGSPLVFSPEDATLPLHISWYANSALDPSKDNTLTIKLVDSNLGNMQFGDPSLPANNNKSTFVFTKKD